MHIFTLLFKCATGGGHSIIFRTRGGGDHIQQKKLNKNVYQRNGSRIFNIAHFTKPYRDPVYLQTGSWVVL